VDELLTTLVGGDRAKRLLSTVLLPQELAGEEQPRGQASRTAVAMALNLVLLDDLLQRVPTGARYVEAQRARGRRLVYDHGAVRTVDWLKNGALPSGVEAIRRVLVPLGYEEVGLYPLGRIHMTGKVFTHADLPEDVPQYFVSELHVDQLPGEAQEAVTRVVGDSTDPLSDTAVELLDRLADEGWLATVDAARLVPVLAGCFGRQHAAPTWNDYILLRAHSAEAAWIATEGNAFNHATDRVDDVDALAAEMRAGWPLKDQVERSRSGRVRQTALRADRVRRRFRTGDGVGSVERVVPGSFFELISRDPLPDGSGLDLTFDAGNAQGIFKMTR
jgi:uncharacterized glyoxalase superfamily metalloenzyme YdcJ